MNIPPMTLTAVWDDLVVYNPSGNESVKFQTVSQSPVYYTITDSASNPSSLSPYDCLFFTREDPLQLSLVATDFLYFAGNPGDVIVGEYLSEA